MYFTRKRAKALFEWHQPRATRHAHVGPPMAHVCERDYFRTAGLIPRNLNRILNRLTACGKEQ